MLETILVDTTTLLLVGSRQLFEADGLLLKFLQSFLYNDWSAILGHSSCLTAVSRGSSWPNKISGTVVQGNLPPKSHINWTTFEASLLRCFALLGFDLHRFALLRGLP